MATGQVFFGKLDRASGLRRNLSLDRPRTQACPGPLTNRTWPDRDNKAIREFARPFTMRLQKESRREAVAARRIKEPETQVGARMKGGYVWGPQQWPQ